MSEQLDLIFPGGSHLNLQARQNRASLGTSSAYPLDIETDSDLRIRIDEVGHVGIGTGTDDLTDRLEVRGSLTTMSLSVTDAIETEHLQVRGGITTATSLTVSETIRTRVIEGLEGSSLKIPGEVEADSLSVSNQLSVAGSNSELALEVNGKAKITGGLIPDYDSDWFDVQANKQYLLTHNLGTSLLVLHTLYKDPNGTVWDAKSTFRYFDEDRNSYPPPHKGFCGFYILLKDNNTLELATAGQLVFGGDNTHTYGFARQDQRWATGKYRVFAWRIGI